MDVRADTALGAHVSETEDALGAEPRDLGWPHEPYVTSPEIAASWDARPRGRRLESEWRACLKSYSHRYPKLAAEFRRRVGMDGAARCVLPADWEPHGAVMGVDRFGSPRPVPKCLNTLD